jgi:hypothetical protein
MADDVADQPAVIVVGGPLDGYDVKLTPGLTLIVGSGRLANLRLDHPEIELAHIKIAWDDLGISMIDNGSRKGTWVNGDPVETAALIDGDTIAFTDPAGKPTTPPAPKVRLKIPKGTVPEPPPLPPPPAGEAATAAPVAARVATAKARGPARRKRSALRMPDVDLRLVGLAAGGLLLLVGAGWFVNRFYFTVPQIVGVVPAQAEMGQTITLAGKRFRHDPGENKVWFGSVATAASASTGDSLQVRVPQLPAPGAVAVSVETPIGRSRPASFLALAPLKATALDPPGALPGDEVAMAGAGFEEGVTVSVDAQPASVVKVEPGSVRFQMPQVAGDPGSVHAVVASLTGRSTQPLSIHLGRLPLVSSLEPSRGVAGDLVRVHGAGFAALGTAVTFDGVPALVVAGDAAELVVIAPSDGRSQAETLVPVVVQAGGRTSTGGPSFTLQRLVEGTWVPRFFAESVGEGSTTGQAAVGTEIAPVLILSAKDESRSVGERALAVARALNAAVDRARVGEAIAFEAREEPAIAVAIVGAPDLLLHVLPQDAAAYETPPGFPVRGAPPAPTALARHWAALLTDTLVIGTTSGRPHATADISPEALTAFNQLRTLLPWQYGSGVASARVVTVPAELRRKLREAAFRVP